MSKILFLIDEINGWGGTERHLFELLRSLDRKLIEPIVAVMYRDAVAKDFREVGIPVESLQAGGVKSRRFLVALQKLAGKVRQEKIELIATFHTASDFLGTLVAKTTRVPVVTCRRDMGFQRTPSQIKLFRRFNTLVDQGIAVCEAVKRAVVEQEGFPPERIAVIYNGVDGQVFAPGSREAREELGIGPEEVVLATLAHFQPIKGYDTILEAAALLVRRVPQARFLLIGAPHGDRSFFYHCQEKAVALGISSRVLFVGGRSDPERLLRSADLFVHFSETEGCSNAILQALASGLPVVASDVGGNPELVDPSCGLVLPPGHAGALAQALEGLALAPSRRAEMGRAARMRALRRFSFEGMVSRYEARFLEIIDQERVRRGVKRQLASAAYSAARPLTRPLMIRTGLSDRDVIVAYHRICDDPDYYDPALVTSRSVFLRQLEALARAFSIVPLSELVESASQGKPRLALTFDDAYADFYEVAFPILCRMGLPSTLFTPTAVLEGKPLWHDHIASLVAYQRGARELLGELLKENGYPEGAEKLRAATTQSSAARQAVCQLKELPTSLCEAIIEAVIQKTGEVGGLPRHLSVNELRALSRAGVEIGAHSRTHPQLTRSSDTRVRMELVEGRAQLEGILGTRVVSLAYPAGAVNPRIREIAAEAGYRYAVTTVPPLGKDPLLLGRVCLSERSSQGLGRLFARGLFLAEVDQALHWARSRAALSYLYQGKEKRA